MCDGGRCDGGLDVTIRPGEPWGREVARPDDLVEVTSDAALARRAGLPTAVRGGDLFRSLGSPRPRGRMQLVDVDGLRVVVDGVEHTAVAHVVMRRSWWRGRVVAVMNVDHLGAWNVAPRAHPNDGRFDVVEVDAGMSLRDRWAARRRLPGGDHVPHPDIVTARRASHSWRFDRPMRVEVDGVAVGPGRAVDVEIVPDRFAVLV